MKLEAILQALMDPIPVSEGVIAFIGGKIQLNLSTNSSYYVGLIKLIFIVSP